MGGIEPINRGRATLTAVAALIALAVFAAPASGAYTAALSGSTATFTGDTTPFQQLAIQSNPAGTFLQHNRQADPSFNSNLDFDSTVGGDQMLANDGTSTVIANGGLGQDFFRVRADTSPIVQAKVTVNGGAGLDVPMRVETDAGDQTVALAGGTITGATGLPVDYSNIEGLELRTGGGSDTVQVGASPSGTALVVGGGGDDRLELANATGLGHRFDAGPGVDTIDYSDWTSPVTIGAPTTATFTAVLNEAQENPPTGSLNAGSGQVVFSDLADPTQPFSYSLAIASFNPADVTDSHIHAAAPGVNGNIVFPIGPGSGYTDNGGGLLTKADTGLTDPEITEPLLREGNTYFNIHTTAFASGEIRGQITLDQDFAYFQPATGTGDISGTENFIGGSGADVIHGTPVANAITGGEGADQLFGEDGDDTLDAVDGQTDVAIDCGAGGADIATRDPATIDADSAVAGCETVTPPLPLPPPPELNKVGSVSPIAARASGKKSKITLATGSAAFCPPGATAACTLTAEASSKIPKKALRAKAAKVLGSLEQSVAPGQTSAPVTFVVSKKFSKAWRKAGKLRIAISIDLAVPGGQAAAVRASSKLKAPKKS